MNLDEDARAEMTTRLCARPLNEAVGEAAALRARLDARRRARWMRWRPTARRAG